MNRILYLAGIPLAAAIPIHSAPTTSNGVTFIAVLFTTLSTLTFLYVFKTLFRRSRRSWFTRLGALAPTSTPAEDRAPVSSKLVHAQPRLGILVGFLGSPTWETCLTLDIHKTLYERRRSFFAVGNPPCTSFKYLGSSLGFQDSNISGHMHLPSISSFGQALELPSLVYQSEKRTVLFAPRPPPALYDSSIVIPQRRYSLPSVVRNAHHAQVRRSCSTKSRRIKHQRPQIDSTSFVPMSPAKVLTDSVKHIFPLSFSPLLDAGISEGYLNLSGPVTTQETEFDSNIILCSPADETSKMIQSSVIEHELTMDSKAVGRDSQDSNCQTTNVLSPLVLNAIPNTFTDSDDELLPPLSPVAMFKLRPRYKLLSVRMKRSPPLGPSPLRTMILPESSDPDLSPRVSREDPSIMTLCNEPNTFEPLPEDGILKSKEQQIVNEPSSRIVQDNDPGSLLGLIRELAEEVNDWDDTLFMDKNFKSMIENSQDILFEKDGGGLAPNLPITSPSLDGDSDRIPESPIKRILQSRNVESNESAGSVVSGGGQLISFWEVDSVHRDEIGIAQ